MIFRLLATSLILFFLSGSSLLLAQEVSECNLPAPENLQAIIVPPDMVDLFWDPVPGAISYDVMVVDLSTNQILYNANELTTSHTISNFIPDSNMIVAVAGICPDLTVGEYGTISPLGIHIDDLVVELDGPNGPQQVIHSCKELASNPVNISWNAFQGTAHVPMTSNTATYTGAVKTFVMVQSGSKKSLVQLNQPYSNGGLQVQFPHRLVSLNFTNNTTSEIWPSLNNPGYDMISEGAFFYSFGMSSNQINLTIPSTYGDSINISTMNCFMGRPTSTIGGDSQGQGVVGRVAIDQVIRPNDQMNLETPSPLILLSPNPANDVLHLTAMPEGQTFQIFDLSGRVWHIGLGTNGQQDILLSHWPPGTYFLHAPAANGKPAISQQFIVH